MEQSKGRAVLSRNFQVQRPFMDGTLESAWFYQSRRRSNAFR